MRTAVAFVLTGLVVTTCPALAAWESRADKDAMTDVETTFASATSDTGTRLQFYRRNGDVWATFLIKPNSMDLIEPNTPLTLRVDQRPALPISDQPDFLKRMGAPQTYIWQPTFINFRLLTGAVTNNNPTMLEQIMTGRILRVRYRVAGGGFSDSVFDLDGAEQALSTALATTLEKERTHSDRLAKRPSVMTAMDSCGSGTPRALACMRKVQDCAKAGGKDPEPEPLAACFKAATNE